MSASALWRPRAQAFAQGAFGVAPITLSDLKAHTRIDAADEDTGVAAYLAAAADMVERHTGRLLTERAVTLGLPGFPDRADQVIELPGGRTASVTSVTYVDAGEDSLTLDAEDRWSDLASVPARLGLAGGAMWPVTRGWGLPVTISYVAGYAADSQPPALLQAVRMIAAELYEQRREGVVGASVAAAPVGAMDLMAPLVIWRMF